MNSARLAHVILIAGMFYATAGLAAPVYSEDMAREEDTSPVYDIPLMKKVVIDGKADDWENKGFRVDLLAPVGAPMKSVADHDARFGLGWNQNGLLVLVSIRDDAWVEHEDEGWLWRYDGVEVFLAAKPGAADMCQWVISPGMAQGQEALRWKLHDHRKDESGAAGLTAKRTKTANRYTLEALLPWSALGIEPEQGREVGFQIIVNDADAEDGDTSHAAWYPAGNTSADSAMMHTVRLAAETGPATTVVGHWSYEWPRASGAALRTRATLVGKEVVVREPGGKVLGSRTVKKAEDGGVARFDLPVQLTDPAITFLDLAVKDVVHGALPVPEDVTYNSTSSFDINAMRDTMLSCKFRKHTRQPDLLFPSSRIPAIMAAAKLQQAELEKLETRCRELIATRPEEVELRFASRQASQAAVVAQGYFFLGRKEYADWAKRRAGALLTLDMWISPLHDVRFLDHVAANIGARLALVHDMLGEEYSAAETRELADGIKRLLFEPYLEAVRGRKEWWTGKRGETNWKIMCHGDAGLAICEFANHWPDAREALAHAALGIVETLDMVPPEGDWHEGVKYWLQTLHMGLRCASALRLMTDGKIDLYEHPALKVTGDYALMLYTPSDRIFNFGDNPDHLGAVHRECLAMLAVEAGRSGWLWVAQRAPVIRPAYLAAVEGDLKPKRPGKTSALFPYTGVATLRSGWNRGDTFVGAKCGPQFVGHGHLDAASFVIESRGRWLTTDTGSWPYAGHLGFHDYQKHRWNWDNCSTIGHNTLLIDGQGQTWVIDPKDHRRRLKGEIRPLQSGKGWDMIVMDAAECYPGLLDKFTRSLLFIKPDVVIVRDVVECVGQRHAEWLLHYAGDIHDEGLVSVIRNQGVSMTVVPFLPDRGFGWRVNDVSRASTYEKQSDLRVTTQRVRYRSFAPFRKAEKFEFLFGMRVNGSPAADDWTFKKTDAGWQLEVHGREMTVHPKDDTLTVRGEP